MSKDAEFIGKLRAQTAAVRFRQDKFGVRRALTPEQQRQTAETFRANAKAIHATKQLLDTKAPEFRAVTQVISRARGYWMSLTVPYPEPGIRLIRRDRVNDFNAAMADFVVQLDDAKQGLRESYMRIRNEAKQQLGDLFNAEDYPPTIDEEFAIEWDYPSLAAPEFLKTLNPNLYEIEQQKLADRFNVAIQLAEEAFTGELQGLVSQLVERLQPGEDGKPKVFRDSAVKNLTEFFDRFGKMAAGSNAELDKLVAQASEVVAGLQPNDLRKDASVRDKVSGALAPILGVLDGLVVSKPKRKISFDAVTTPPAALPAETDDADQSDADQSDVVYDTSESQEIEKSEAA